jgi:hypothetical protein
MGFALSAAPAMRQRRGFEVRNICDIRPQANVETKTTLGFNDLPVSFDSEFAWHSI